MALRRRGRSAAVERFEYIDNHIDEVKCLGWIEDNVERLFLDARGGDRGLGALGKVRHRGVSSGRLRRRRWCPDRPVRAARRPTGRPAGNAAWQASEEGERAAAANERRAEFARTEQERVDASRPAVEQRMGRNS
jgi:hypothetical protein